MGTATEAAASWFAAPASSPAAAVTSTPSLPKNPPMPPRTTRLVCRIIASSPSSARTWASTSSIVSAANCLICNGDS